eukprot:8159-Heterococcus_DN1.PRE.6
MSVHSDSLEKECGSNESSAGESECGDRQLRLKRPYVPKPGVEIFVLSILRRSDTLNKTTDAARALLSVWYHCGGMRNDVRTCHHQP